jgi:hypothetical protein
MLRGPGIPPDRRDDPSGHRRLPDARASWASRRLPRCPADLLAAGTPPPSAVLETSRGIGPDGAPCRSSRCGWHNGAHRAPVARHELYDLANDPGERADRAASALRLAELGAALERWRLPRGPPPRRHSRRRERAAARARLHQ